MENLETQKDFKRLAGARSIMLDVYASDSDNRKYDLEIQRADHGADQFRARYHSSCMDVENLHTGQDFSELPVTYCIFITENDIFGKGKPFYRIERVNLEDGELFHDDAHILYVNGAYRGNSDIGRLMHDFCCWNPEDMNFDLMRVTARYYKENPKGVEIMSKAFEETRREAEYQAKIDIAKNMIAIGTISLNVIASVTMLPLETIQNLSRQKPAFNPSMS